MASEQRITEGLRELALFAGAGGGILGGKLLGWRTICAVEINAFCARRLMQRQNEGHLPPFPIWDDVCSFDGHPWRGRVDVVSGGFPCQDISAANGSGLGLDGPRSGLWREYKRALCEIQPAYALIENSPRLVIRGLHRILSDLAELGYDAKWGVVSAADSMWLGGTPAFDHLRERLFIAASNPNRMRELQSEGCEQDQRRRISNSSEASTYSDCDTARGLPFGEEAKHAMPKFSNQTTPNTNGERQSKSGKRGIWSGQETTGIWKTNRAINVDWWTTESDVDRMAYGVANGLERGRCVGNGQVPAVVKLAWETLIGNP